ncbi:MAG TPA: YXWGXW repeat-containing protein [Acetobacteraceae bacterium]|nr:YXWGXW repeat-containing protein [Acetobacteraceae bacterium]
MKQVLAAALTGLMALALSGCAQQPAPSPGPPPPPPPRAESIPKPPVTATPLIWQPGHWDWTGTGYAWDQGRWVERAGHGAMWQDGYWQGSGATAVWVPGHWM